MKPYTKLIYTLAAAAAASIFSACDSIGSDERFIELPPVETQRVVLLEEFTGQKCQNCPKAHDIIATLLQQYPDNLISVSIHGGGSLNTFPESLPFGLCNEQGEAYCSDNNVNFFPAGIVNRTSGVQTMDLWSNAIRNEMARPSNVAISLGARLSADGSKIEITSALTGYVNMEPNYQLWVVESGIVARQTLPDGSMQMDYVHNHVFRADVNGHGGEAVQLKIDRPVSLHHDIDIKPRWNTANLAIVGFVYDSKGVHQAAIAHLEAE